MEVMVCVVVSVPIVVLVAFSSPAIAVSMSCAMHPALLYPGHSSPHVRPLPRMKRLGAIDRRLYR